MSSVESLLPRPYWARVLKETVSSREPERKCFRLGSHASDVTTVRYFSFYLPPSCPEAYERLVVLADVPDDFFCVDAAWFIVYCTSITQFACSAITNRNRQCGCPRTRHLPLEHIHHTFIFSNINIAETIVSRETYHRSPRSKVLAPNVNVAVQHQKS